jgi:hypothetical protein
MARSHAPIVGPGQPIELPDALRSAAPFAVLALVAAALLLVPDVPPAFAAVAALAFALAALTRAAQQHRELRQMEASIDRVLLRKEATPLSPLLVWRAGRLCSDETRERLAASLRHAERSAATSHLAGASPLNRPGIRASRAEIDAVAERLASPEPVHARGVLLVRILLDDPGSPLYGNAPGSELRASLRQALSALGEPAETVR